MVSVPLSSGRRRGGWRWSTRVSRPCLRRASATMNRPRARGRLGGTLTSHMQVNQEVRGRMGSRNCPGYRANRGTGGACMRLILSLFFAPPRSAQVSHVQCMRAIFRERSMRTHCGTQRDVSARRGGGSDRRGWVMSLVHFDVWRGSARYWGDVPDLTNGRSESDRLLHRLCGISDLCPGGGWSRRGVPSTRCHPMASSRRSILPVMLPYVLSGVLAGRFTAAAPQGRAHQ